MKSNSRIVHEQAPELNLLVPLTKSDLTNVKPVRLDSNKFETNQAIANINANIVRENLQSNTHVYINLRYEENIYRDIFSTNYSTFDIEFFIVPHNYNRSNPNYPFIEKTDLTNFNEVIEINRHRSITGDLNTNKLSVLPENTYKALKNSNRLPTDDYYYYFIVKISW